MGVFLEEVRKGPVPILIFFNLLINYLKVRVGGETNNDKGRMDTEMWRTGLT